MARAKTKKPKNVTKLVLAILLVALAYFAYQHITVANNKNNFQKARTAIDSVYADVSSQLGKPDDSSRTNSCGKSASVITCSVSTSFIYGVDSSAQAEAMFKKIQSAINTNGTLKQTLALSPALKTPYKNYDGAQDFYKTGNLACSAKYLYDTPQATFLKLKDETKKPFYVILGCTGPAKKKFY